MSFKPSQKPLSLCQARQKSPAVFTRNFMMILSANVILGSAMPMLFYMGRVGRQKGFLLATVLLILGAVLGVSAMIQQHFILLCVAYLVLGVAFVGINFLRFAAAEAVPGRWTSSAISYILASGLVAAFIGPEVFSAIGGLCAGLCNDCRAW